MLQRPRTVSKLRHHGGWYLVMDLLVMLGQLGHEEREGCF